MNFLDRFKLKLAKRKNSICKTSDGITHIFSERRYEVGKLDINGRKTGLWITKSPNGIIKSATYLDGKLNGPYSSHQEEEVYCIPNALRKRVIETSGVFTIGFKEGIWTEGLASGKYSNGLRTGLWQIPNVWNELITGHYSRGLKTGVWKGENSKYVFNDDTILEAQELTANGHMLKRQYQNGKKIYSQEFDHTGFMFLEIRDGIKVRFWKDWKVQSSERPENYTFQRHDKSDFFEIYSQSRMIMADELLLPDELIEFTITDGRNNYPIEVALKYASIFYSGSYQVEKNPKLIETKRSSMKSSMKSERKLYRQHYTLNGISVFWDEKNKEFHSSN